MCIFLLSSGLFCCLGFSGEIVFAVWAGARAPPKQQKKTRPRPNSKKINTPPPLPSVFVFHCLGGWVCCFFCCLGGGRVVFFAAWAGGVLFLFFCVFGRGVFMFCCLVGGVLFCFAVGAGDGSSLTYRSAWLVFKRPNNKKDQTAKQNKKKTKTRVPAAKTASNIKKVEPMSEKSTKC